MTSMPATMQEVMAARPRANTAIFPREKALPLRPRADTAHVCKTQRARSAEPTTRNEGMGDEQDQFSVPDLTGSGMRMVLRNTFLELDVVMEVEPPVLLDWKQPRLSGLPSDLHKAKSDGGASTCSDGDSSQDSVIDIEDGHNNCDDLCDGSDSSRAHDDAFNDPDGNGTAGPPGNFKATSGPPGSFGAALGPPGSFHGASAGPPGSFAPPGNLNFTPDVWAACAWPAGVDTTIETHGCDAEAFGATMNMWPPVQFFNDGSTCGWHSGTATSNKYAAESSTNVSSSPAVSVCTRASQDSEEAASQRERADSTWSCSSSKWADMMDTEDSCGQTPVGTTAKRPSMHPWRRKQAATQA